MDELLKNLKISVSDSLYLKDPESSELGRKIIGSGILLIDRIGFEKFTFKKTGSRNPVERKFDLPIFREQAQIFAVHHFLVLGLERIPVDLRHLWDRWSFGKTAEGSRGDGSSRGRRYPFSTYQ